ncbi:MAG: LUD domain-containing protein [Defluviicoccus sp.]|nr:LUD domain-containing protein [Defluviicoccus sp.]MDG4593780.1 LUD domain-containing protein [Defluviicoccus sp.]MDS4010733.1 LUD domain-containing protein [Defluviicoccus sp.]MDS4073122.1 LUD domain-containing protein [Defluviicoccus sp.]
MTAAADPARAAMLARIQNALGRGAPSEEQRRRVLQRCAAPSANLIPARGRENDRIAQFIAEAERVNATTERLAGWSAVPAAVAETLAAAGLPPRLRMVDDARLASLAWPAGLAVATGKSVDGDRASLAIAFAGIAETGTVMLLSSPSSPATLNFLPEMHIVILPEAVIVGAYEDAWANLRAALGVGVMPRVVNWITGPSRTADIEQTLLLGAHGPRLLHILLLAEA